MILPFLTLHCFTTCTCRVPTYASCGACGQVLRDRVLTQSPFKKDKRKSSIRYIHKVYLKAKQSKKKIEMKKVNVYQKWREEKGNCSYNNIYPTLKNHSRLLGGVGWGWGVKSYRRSIIVAEQSRGPDNLLLSLLLGI